MNSNTIKYIGAIAVIGIATLFFLNDDSIPSDSTDQDEHVEESAEGSIKLQDMEVDPHILNWVLERPSFDYEDLNRMIRYRIYNSVFSVPLIHGWTRKEEDDGDMHSSFITGPESERMNIYIFDYDVEEKQISEKIDRILSQITFTESTVLPYDTVIEKLESSFDTYPFFGDFFVFNKEETEMYAFLDATNGRLTELYITKLFGQPLIFTGEFPLTNKEHWHLPWVIFSQIHLQKSPYIIQGTEGEEHPKYQRPMEKDVVHWGSPNFQPVHLELYENEELGFTSYLPSNTNVERIEYDHFTEWRFSNPAISKHSYYSFGKLKENFPLDQGREIMFSALEIENEQEEYYGEDPYYYNYYNGEDGNYSGYVTLFEQSGSWYYRHIHEDYQDYNGGRLWENLSMFVDYMEWH